jgi:glycosyltransferase involved in cell wall biosynthesis
MKRRVLITIPAYNEAETIGKVIANIQETFKKEADILLVNDCSSDDTEKIIKSFKDVLCITNAFNLGYAMSVQTGIKYAAQNDYDFVIQMDADGQHLPEEAKKILQAAEEKDADIVIGGRYYEGSDYESPFFRRFGAKLFKHLIKIFCRETINDPLSGLQCLNKRVISYYAQAGAYPKYPDAGLLIEMLIKGYKIVEVPVKMRQREAGTSMHDGFFGPAKYMITQIYSCVVVFIKFSWRKR